MSEIDPWSTRFPDLFRDAYVDYADCQVRYTTDAAPDELVSRLHLVAHTAEGEVVVCRSDQGWRFLPGGTREPGESLHELARRELMEEAGAVLDGELRYFAAHMADSNRKTPYRPHIPHPRAFWAYAIAQVHITGASTRRYPSTRHCDGAAVTFTLLEAWAHRPTMGCAGPHRTRQKSAWP